MYYIIRILHNCFKTILNFWTFAENDLSPIERKLLLKLVTMSRFKTCLKGELPVESNFKKVHALMIDNFILIQFFVHPTANFGLPAESKEGEESPFKEITFVELQREEAAKLIEGYNKVNKYNLLMLICIYFQMMLKRYRKTLTKN